MVAGLGSRSSLSRVRADAREGRGSAHDEGGEGDEGEEGEATGEADQGTTPNLAQTSQISSASQRPVSRATDSYLDHLGHPLKSSSRQKFRYARTYTVIYDTKREESLRRAEAMGPPQGHLDPPAAQG